MDTLTLHPRLSPGLRSITGWEGVVGGLEGGSGVGAPGWEALQSETPPINTFPRDVGHISAHIRMFWDKRTKSELIPGREPLRKLQHPLALAPATGFGSRHPHTKDLRNWG